MKHLLFFSISLLLLSGCTYKNEALFLEAYNAQYAGPMTKNKPTVHLRIVKDLRSDKQTIGALLNNGKVLAPLATHSDIEKRYYDGLLSALKLAGFDTDSRSREAALVLEVYVKDIDIVYNDKNFDTNLKGEIEIEVVIRKESEVITQNFRQKGGKWMKPSFESKDLEPFLYELFTDSIDQVVSRLVRI